MDENYGEYNSADYQSDTSDNEYNDEYMQDTPRLTLDDFSEEDLENMTEEELAQLEAEFNADLENESNSDYNDYNNYSDYKTTGSGYVDTNFAEKLAEGITLGLTQGLSQGLAQGLSQGLQGLGQGFNSGGNQGFDNNWSSSNQGGFNDNYNSNFNGPSGGQNTNAGFDFADNSNNQQWGQQSQYQTAVPDYNKIDTINNDAAMNARDSYSYDENSNLDDISDLYADFYDENKVEEEVYNEESTNSTQANKNSNTQNTSEIDALKAELEALKAEAETKKDLMTLDEFMAKQKELAEAKESKRRQKLRILGSKERVNASALDGGVFGAGNKVYKWGDTRVLDP